MYLHVVGPSDHDFEEKKTNSVCTVQNTTCFAIDSPKLFRYDLRVKH